jgi:CRP-like cAMP-binding protein
MSELSKSGRVVKGWNVLRETRENLLSGWLGKVEPSLSEVILKTGQLRTYSQGETIFGIGQSHGSLHCVAKGLVQMWFSLNEQEQRFGHIVGPGFWFGEVATITGTPAKMEVVATAGTKVFILSRKQIDRIAETHASMWYALALLAAMNQGTAIGAADDLMIRNSERRLAAVLLRLSSRRSAYQGVPPLDVIPISWNELGEASNLSRSKVGSILSEFTRKGYIRTRQRSIEILDFAGLEALLPH